MCRSLALEPLALAWTMRGVVVRARAILARAVFTHESLPNLTSPGNDGPCPWAFFWPLEFFGCEYVCVTR
eukprot:3314131-Prymnesium_polylepis.1